jgi:UPF0755 protein
MFKKIAVLIAILGIALLVFFSSKIRLFFEGRLTTINRMDQEFFFDAAVGLQGLAAQLAKEEIIDDESALVSVASYKNLDKNKIASGKYVIKPGTTYRELLNGFSLNGNGNGNAEVEVEVTFNNCKNIYQLAGKVSKSLLLDSAHFVSYIENGVTLATLGFSLNQIPALFLPNTYRMYYDTDEQQFVARMAKEFKSFWTSERKEKMQKIGLTSPSQVVTLASIVYSEQSKKPEEWPVIAGLYLNRINKGIKLQSDPTFKFCWGDQLDGVQRLLVIHREIDCLYNTYQILGLPPGPICIPSALVVDAVLNSPKVEYIFMCAKPDYSGLHNFAISGREHSKNAAMFQNWLAKELKNN